MADKPKKDADEKVVYLKRQPGFYKKGPGQFELNFGTFEEIREKALQEAEQEARLKTVPPEEDRPA